MELIFSDRMGYCGGVSRAIGMVERAIEEAREQHIPVFSLGKVIHNLRVCSTIAEQGLNNITAPSDNPTEHV